MKKISLNLENKNVIITGGSGFLGSQIIDALLNEKANVFIIDIQKPKKKNISLRKVCQGSSYSISSPR